MTVSKERGKTRLPQFLKFRRIARPLIEKIPPAEYPKLLREAEDLVNTILTDPELFEPIHCPDGHGHPVVRQLDRTSLDVAKSRQALRRMTSEIADKAGKIAVSAMSMALLWTAAENAFWWF